MHSRQRGLSDPCLHLGPPGHLAAIDKVSGEKSRPAAGIGVGLARVEGSSVTLRRLSSTLGSIARAAAAS
jgi:hypothetical protein